MKKWAWRALLLLLAAALLAAAAAWLTLRRSLPATAGELQLSGLAAPVLVQRDEHGIPSVRAQSLDDLFFGLGVVHAQDRLWQLETHRRIASGRLAEAFGPAALETDRFLRALGVRRAAQAQWERLSADSRQALLSYTRGINTYVREQMKARPPEFLILGLEFEPFEPVDCLGWAIMMAWDLGGNWSTELMRMRLALRMPLPRVDVMLPPYPGEAPLATADYAALYRGLGLSASAAQVKTTQGQIDRLLAVAPPSGVEGVGSNNWVVAGSHTRSGKPLLANDPHLKLSAPALWYFVRLQAPGVKMAGASMPGLPLVVLGQNDHLAWGFTNTGPDVQDLYLEQLDADDATRYRTPEGWARFETHAEIIKVKGQPDVAFVHRRTRHGPVISDAGTAADVLGTPARHVLALRWTALETDMDLVGAGLGMTRARNVSEFIQSASGWLAPMQNMVVADREGRIGFVAAGRVPLRKAENDLKGLVPAPGWEARYDWAGWLPYAQVPSELDPARGWIATANQRITAAGYPHYITNEWALPYRQQRIEQMLASRERHGLEDLAAMQADVRSLAAAELLPWLRKAQSEHSLAAAAHRELQGFDGEMAAAKAAPLIYWAWRRQLAQAIFGDEVDETFWKKGLATRSFQDSLTLVLQRNDGGWCDDRRTPGAETCAQMNDLAFTRALQELEARFGSNVAAWQWGQAHVARSEHRPFSRVKELARFFELRSPTPGDTFTVNVSRVGLAPDASTGELYLNEHGPSLRALYDLGDPAQSRVMHSTGQSGHPLSRWHASFVRPWAEVRYVPLWPSSAAAAAHSLTLQPAR